MRSNASSWLIALAVALGTSAATAADRQSYYEDADDGINWFSYDGYQGGTDDEWEYDSDLIGDDEWEYDDDNWLTDDDGSNWGSDQYGDYDGDYNWGTDDDSFDSWYGDSDASFGSTESDD